MHDDVDAGAERHLALVLAAGDDGIERPARAVERPSRREIVRGDEDRAYAVGAARLAGAVVAAAVVRLDPELAAVPAARERAQQVKRLGQHVLLGHWLEAR